MCPVKGHFKPLTRDEWLENGGDNVESGRICGTNREGTKKWQSNDMMKETATKSAGKQRKKWEGWGVFLKAMPEKDLRYFGRDRCPSAHLSSPSSPRHCYIYVSVLCAHSVWDKEAYKANTASHPRYFILFVCSFCIQLSFAFATFT